MIWFPPFSLPKFHFGAQNFMNLQKYNPAMQSDRAQIFFWGARALYLGKAFGLEPHRNAVAVLCAGVSGPFEIARDLKTPGAGYTEHRMALIPANTLHHLKAGAATMAFLYLDTQSSDYVTVKERATGDDERLVCGFPMQDQYIDVLEKLAGGGAWSGIRTEIAIILGFEKPIRRDERIAAALRHLREDPGGTHDLGQLARRACLSPSRFQHLFKEATGVAVRRYRLWNRMGCAVRAMAAGESLMDAALRAGFSSAAHFSAAFSDMFGMPPSRLARPYLQIQESPPNPM
jgi:AraC-like DNA-binding protein